MTDREHFEQWYAENAFDFAANPIGSRECGLQWAAWQAASLPREPTEAMLAASEALPGCEAASNVLILHQIRTGRDIPELHERLDAAIWRAMYDAAKNA